MKKRRSVESLFVNIGRLEAKSKDLANAQDYVGDRTALEDVSKKLEEAWRILSDRGIVA